MADDVAITPGAGATFATDDVAGRHFQRIKLATSEADSAEPIGDTDLGASRAVWADLRTFSTRIAVNSSGLTTVTTNYTSGDQVGAEMAFAAASRAGGLGGLLKSAVIISKSSVLPAMDLYLFDSASTPAADNAAAAWSTTNIEKLQGILSFAGATAVGTPNVATLKAIDLLYVPAATSLFGNLVARGALNFFTAATDIRVILSVLPF